MIKPRLTMEAAAAVCKDGRVSPAFLLANFQQAMSRSSGSRRRRGEVVREKARNDTLKIRLRYQPKNSVVSIDNHHRMCVPICQNR